MGEYRERVWVRPRARVWESIGEGKGKGIGEFEDINEVTTGDIREGMAGPRA